MRLPTRKDWLLLGAVTALPVLADGLAVKTGAWETTVRTRTSGLIVPEEALASMTAQQRTQMEALVGTSAAGPPPSTSKSCMTQKDIDDGAFRAQQLQKESQCNFKPVASGAKHQEWTFECPSQPGGASGRMVVDATDSTHVTGEVNIKAEGVSITTTFTSRWLGDSCAEVDK